MKVFTVQHTFADLSTNSNGKALNVEHLEGVSYIADVTSASGPLTGSFKLQVSNNAFIDNTNNNENPTASWIDYAGSQQAVAGTITLGWNVTDIYFKAIRLVWSSTSGTGSAIVNVQAKGVS